MQISIQAIMLHGPVPFSELKAECGLFFHRKQEFKAETLDALLLRTLMQQPQSGDGYMIGARNFAPILALLRQHSTHCVCEEDVQIAGIQILTLPPDVILDVHDAGAAAISPGSDMAVSVCSRYRCPETGADLGEPLFRTASYWTFTRHVAPPPDLPKDSAFKIVFENAGKAAIFSGEAALDAITRARSAAKENICVLRLDEKLSKVNNRISAKPLRTRIRIVTDSDDGMTLKQDWLTPEGIVVPDEVVRNAHCGKTADGGGEGESDWVNWGGCAYRMPESVAHFKLPSSGRLNEDDVADFIAGELPRLQAAGADIDPQLTKLNVCNAMKPAMRVNTAGASKEDVSLQWSFEAAAANGSAESIAPVEILAAAAGGRRYMRRNNTFVRVDREAVMRSRRQIEQLEARAGSDIGLHCGEGHATGEQIPELLAWANRISADPNSPWNLYVSEAVDGAHKVKDQPAGVQLHLDVEEEEGNTWFTLDPSFDHGGEKMSETQLRKMVAKGQKWFRKDNQWIKVDSAALAKFDQQIEASGIERLEPPADLPEELELEAETEVETPSRWRRRRKQLYYRFKPATRDRVTDIFSLSGTAEHSDRYQQFLDQLKGFDNIEPLPTPKGMTLALRPYQQQGFEWLAFLTRYGLNGVLADDMGLGKTAQTIAQLTRMKEEFGSAPSLIVTPTSLVDNWRNEVAKFSPGLKVLAYRGAPQRRDELRTQFADYDIVLGTYATIRNDATLLRKNNWRYVILDEAHFIKNSAAATTKAIKTIPAHHRLALTGTPIQNRLTELWSLFDFLMPEFLGRQMRFRENFEDPIARLQSGRAETAEEQEQGEQSVELLRQRIRPFVLRRLKTDVAKELPPKIENDIFCSLSPEQVALYRGFADSAEAKEAVNEIIEKGVDGARSMILSALTSLRKICNHPDLMCLPKNAGRQRIENPLEGYENRSGKFEALTELMQRCKEGGHRALIFCQQTTMLDLIGHFLRGKGMKYLRLDGETPGSSRQGLVEIYNNDPTIDAFLISTRAGGAGLNLTGADTVIFYDHDWNPANDQQAQDRAYRIGQKRTVNVYRLICKGTLEEKILRRQTLKKMLANSIVQHDVSGLKALSREDLLSLFTLDES